MTPNIYPKLLTLSVFRITQGSVPCNLNSYDEPKHIAKLVTLSLIEDLYKTYLIYFK